MNYLTLRELTYLIKSTIDSTLPDEYRVTSAKLTNKVVSLIVEL